MRANSARLDIAFDIDWHEDEKLLSLVVPIDVHTREATCDIQFGHVKRPTHASSSWDAAKFEVCAHRFVDLSEPSFGVAVLNDGRYGHGVQEGGVSVSLLRAAKYPDPDADHGRHAVTISVLPHGPGLHDVLHEAEALNVPLRLVAGRATDDTSTGGHTRPARRADQQCETGRRRVGRPDRASLRGLRRPHHADGANSSCRSATHRAATAWRNRPAGSSAATASCR